MPAISRSTWGSSRSASRSDTRDTSARPARACRSSRIEASWASARSTWSVTSTAMPTQCVIRPSSSGTGDTETWFQN